MPKLLKILIEPLDWGMGHAARCVPLIKFLQKNGCEVLIGANKEQQEYLEKELEHVQFIYLQGYQVRYGRTALATQWKIIKQIPTIAKAIRNEHKWLQGAIKSYKIDAVISDNRFGLYASEIPTVFMTHQLNIKTPFGAGIINFFNHRFIKKFAQCWIPDYERENTLAGDLSIATKQLKIHYVGALSRFLKDESKDPLEKKCLLIMSGVEPQKSMLRDIIVTQCNHLKIPLTIAGNDTAYKIENIIAVKNCNTAELYQLIKEHPYIISRTGYTTIMDLDALERTALLIPTPGQTEQEYLGEFHKGKKFVIQQQENIDIETAINQLDKIVYEKDESPIIFEGVVSKFLASLR